MPLFANLSICDMMFGNFALYINNNVCYLPIAEEIFPCIILNVDYVDFIKNKWIISFSFSVLDYDVS